MVRLRRNYLVVCLLHLVSVESISPGDVENCTVSPCSGPAEAIFCRGTILSLRWKYGLHTKFESAELSKAPAKILDDFQKVSHDPQSEKKFLNEIFLNDTGIVDFRPPDWIPSPKNLNKIADPALREFANFVHGRWLHLTKKIKDDVKIRPDRFSITFVPNHFIVPGGRFSNYFYWDSYWIIKGLLFSEMNDTVEGILQNFQYLVEIFGYVPNCGLLPCQRRSQPPFFAMMAELHYEQLGDKSLITLLLPALDQEMKHWENNRKIAVNGHNLFRYDANTTCPRPEEYDKDIQTASSSTNPSFVFKNLAAAAESGLDFSSKWLETDQKENGLSEIITDRVVPVELNAFMCKNYAILAKFYEKLGNPAMAEAYRSKRENILAAIEDVFWNETDGIWYDYDTLQNNHRNQFHATNIAPLFAECYPPEAKHQKIDGIVSYWQNNGLANYPGGVPQSLYESGQQWDFPNMWAPYADIIVDGFIKTGDPRLRNFALDLVNKFIRNTYNGWDHTGFIFEKYNVSSTDGKPGGGGEYKTQVGFGWTNGVILDFIRKYEKEIYLHAPGMSNPDVPTGPQPGVVVALVLVLGMILAAIGFLAVCAYRRRQWSRTMEYRQLLENDMQDDQLGLSP